MRFVRKRGSGPFQLAQAHSNPPTTKETATSRWKSFNYSAQVQGYLLEEQFSLCCYSEIRPDLVGVGMHIEHVENKSQHPQRTFDYSNLAACALDSRTDLKAFAAQEAEVFGGHAPGKASGVDFNRFVACHQPDCARFFTYVSDGRVLPADGLSAQEEDRARYTIELLNLNSTYLKDLRFQWWGELEKLVAQHIDQDMSLDCLAGIDLVPINGNLSPFFSMTRQIFASVAERVLERDAPDLH